MTQKTVKGVIVFDVNMKEYRFSSILSEAGVTGSDDYIFVCDHTLSFDLPEGFDTIATRNSTHGTQC